MNKIYVYIIIFAVLLSSCLDTIDMPGGILNEKKEPTVATKGVTLFEEKTLLCEGIIEYQGVGTILSKGFCWSTTNKMPTAGVDNTIQSPVTSSDFIAYLKDLTGSKTYYLRAYAQNEYGYSYGDVVSYATPKIWEERPIFQPQIRTYAAVFSIDDRFYISCGQNTEYLLGDTWIFNVTENRWRSHSDYPGEKRRQSTAFVLGTSAFVGTGGEGRSNVYFNNFYGLNMEEREWNQDEILSPFAPRSECIGVGFDGSGFVIGGRFSSLGLLSEVWKYASGKDNEEGYKWMQMKDFPIPIYNGIGLNKNNERLFAGLGYDKDGPAKDIWEYDATTDQWNLFSTAPEAFSAAYSGSGTIIGNKAYIVDNQNNIWELDLLTATWKIKTTLPDVFKKTMQKDISQYIYSYNNSIFVGLNNTDLFYEYRPLWDNN